MQSKHILILTPGFPKDESDDNCIPPLQEFLKAFTNSYPQVKFSVITLHYPHKKEKYSWNRIQVIPLSGEDSRIKKPLNWIKAINAAKQLNEECQINTIHSFWFGECAMIGNFLSNKSGCKHICTMMGQDAIKPNLYQTLSIRKKIKIIAISKNQAIEFLKRTGRNADEIINWGINNSPINIMKRDIDLLAVGSLIPLKNYSSLIKVVNEIKSVKPDVKCILVGSGTEETKLKSNVMENGLGNNISFTGLLSRAEIMNLMQRSKILVHPSTFEGFGYVFAEALVNGMNIISFNVGAAHNHPKWFIAKNEGDFIAITKKILNNNLDFTPTNLFPLNQTVEHYASIYGIK